MTQIGIAIEIVMGGVVGMLPGAGTLLVKKVGSEVVESVRAEIEREFTQNEVEYEALKVKATTCDAHKKAWKDGKKHLFLNIHLTISYHILNHDEIAEANAEGWQRVGLSVSRLLLDDLPARVEDGIRTRLVEAIQSKFAHKLKQGLQDNALDPLAVMVEVE